METSAEMFGPVGRASLSKGAWGLFVDEESDGGFFDHMTDKVLVKFFGESWEAGPWIVPNRFPPNCRAERHAHNYDTIYIIMSGSMNFNDGSGWYHPGDVRWVRANNFYGPEEAGEEGCEFILVSAGPIEVRWESGEVYDAAAS